MGESPSPHLPLGNINAWNSKREGNSLDSARIVPNIVKTAGLHTFFETVADGEAFTVTVCVHEYNPLAHRCTSKTCLSQYLRSCDECYCCLGLLWFSRMSLETICQELSLKHGYEFRGNSFQPTLVFGFSLVLLAGQDRQRGGERERSGVFQII